MDPYKDLEDETVASLVENRSTEMSASASSPPSC